MDIFLLNIFLLKNIHIVQELVKLIKSKPFYSIPKNTFVHRKMYILICLRYLHKLIFTKNILRYIVVYLIYSLSSAHNSFLESFIGKTFGKGIHWLHLLPHTLINAWLIILWHLHNSHIVLNFNCSHKDIGFSLMEHIF